MKYCTVCKVNVNQKHDNCPLCGSYLYEEGKPFEAYAKTEPYIEYPEIQLTHKVDFLRLRANLLLLLLTAVCVAIDLFLGNMTLSWSSYVIIGAVIVMLCVFVPIAYKKKLYSQIAIDLPVLTAASIMLELVINGFSGIAITLRWILPSLYAAGILLCDVMIISESRTSRYFGYFTALLFCTVLVALFQILLWSIPAAREYSSVYSVMVFFGSLLNIGASLLFGYRLLKAEYDRKMSI